MNSSILNPFREDGIKVEKSISKSFRVLAAVVGMGIVGVGSADAAQLVHFNAEELALGVATHGQVMLDGAAAAGANNGNLYSGVTVVSGGVAGGNRAIQFDGVDDQAQINYPQYGGMSGMQNNGAVSFWYNIPTGSLQNGPIVTMTHSGGSNYEDYDMYIWSESGSLRAGTANGNPGQYAFINGTMNVNSWTHVVFTWEPGAEQLYVNGTQVASSSTQSPVMNSAFLDFNILFGNAYGLGGKYKGLMDEISLYDNHLSQADVTTLYNIPEPASLGLIGLGVTALAGRARRR